MLRGRTQIRPARLLCYGLLCGAAMLLGQVAEASEIYRWRDAEGVAHYSDKKPDTAAVEPLQLRDEAAAAPALPRPATPASTATAAAPATLPSRQDIAVSMYLSPRCGWCRKAARYFDQRGVPWRALDITASAQAKREFEAAGGRGTPLIFIQGQRISGFDEARLNTLLARYGW